VLKSWKIKSVDQRRGPESTPLDWQRRDETGQRPHLSNEDITGHRLPLHSSDSGRVWSRKSPTNWSTSKLDVNDRRRITLLTPDPLRSSQNIASEIHRRGSPSVDPSTVWRSLQRSGIKKWYQEKTLSLDSKPEEDPPEWCLRNREGTGQRLCLAMKAIFSYTAHN